MKGMKPLAISQQKIWERMNKIWYFELTD